MDLFHHVRIALFEAVECAALYSATANIVTYGGARFFRRVEPNPMFVVWGVAPFAVEIERWLSRLQTHDVTQLLDEVRVESLNRPTRCGCSPCCRQIFRIVPSLSPCAFASGRLLQWVATGGRVVSVASTTAGTFSRLICLRRPGRDASRSSPGIPSRTNRSAHKRTVIRLIPKSSATDDGGS